MCTLLTHYFNARFLTCAQVLVDDSETQIRFQVSTITKWSHCVNYTQCLWKDSVSSYLIDRYHYSNLIILFRLLSISQFMCPISGAWSQIFCILFHFAKINSIRKISEKALPTFQSGPHPKCNNIHFLHICHVASWAASKESKKYCRYVKIIIINGKNVFRCATYIVLRRSGCTFRCFHRVVKYIVFTAYIHCESHGPSGFYPIPLTSVPFGWEFLILSPSRLLTHLSST